MQQRQYLNQRLLIRYVLIYRLLHDPRASTCRSRRHRSQDRHGKTQGGNLLLLHLS
jgi:hypothetical protein